MMNLTTVVRRGKRNFALRFSLASLFLLGVASLPASAQQLFFEDFEGLTLGERVDEGLLSDNKEDAVYSPTPPAGWTIDNTETPAGGVTEFRGWNFVSPAWWAGVAGQSRDQFAFSDVIVVADGDEWDDKSHEPGLMNTFLKSPPIPVKSGDTLDIVSSWRAEAPQEAVITAKYNNAQEAVEILHWCSSEAPALSGFACGPIDNDFLFGHNPDAIDDLNIIPLDVPAGASTVELSFGYINAGNNWWWAIDSIELGNFVEDWSSVVLGENVDEGRLPPDLQDQTKVWTKTPPAGWVQDDSGVPGIEEVNDGVTEWAGWSFAKKNWWVAVAGDQRRSEFSHGEGTVMIADPDEWDDQSHPASADNGWYQTIIDTGEISLEGVSASELELSFANSWRPEFDSNYRQAAIITAKFNSGGDVEIVRWLSAEGNVTDEFLDGDLGTLANTYANGDKINEELTFTIAKPDGATSVVLEFEMFDAGNDWWWAIDNLELSVPGPDLDCNGDGNVDGMDLACQTDLTLLTTLQTDLGVLPGDFDGVGGVDFSDFLNLSAKFGQPAANYGDGDINLDGQTNFADFLQLSANFGKSAGAAAAAVPEPSSLVLALFGLAGLTLRRRTSRC